VPASLRREIGQLLIGSLPATTITPEMRSLAREFQLGGVTLFKRNIEAPEQVAELSHDLQSLGSDLPVWVAVDQEGGRVARLRTPFTEWPPMATLGRAGDEKLAYRFAAALATELRAVGVTLDYAPVLDILTNSQNPVIGDRALSEDALAVAQLGSAIIRGLQENGIAACGKHFPGHGDTSQDSHIALPLVEHPPDRIRRVELVPFEATSRSS
jgi:beta-N-acetylhexosaminidase